MRPSRWVYLFALFAAACAAGPASAPIPAPAPAPERVAPTGLSQKIAEAEALVSTNEKSTDHRAQVIGLRDLARLYVAARNGERAEATFLRALATAERTLGREDPQVGALLQEMARLYSAHRHYQRADEFLERALSIAEKHDDPQLTVASVLNDTARLAAARGDRQRAETLHKQAIEAARSSPRDLAAAWIGLAELYQATSIERAAHEALVRATASQSEVGNCDLTAAEHFRRIGDIHYGRGDYERAEHAYRRSLDCELANHGKEHPNAAVASVNLGLASQKLGQYSRAEELYRDALAVTKRSRGERHPDVASVLNNIASIHETRAEYRSADELYRQALGIYADTPGYDERVATVQNNLAMLYQAIGDYKRADALYRESLAIRERALGETNLDVGASLNNLARLSELRRDSETAETLYRRAHAIYANALGHDHPDTLAVSGNIASLRLSSGDLQGAHALLAQGKWSVGLGRYYLLKQDYRRAHTEFSQAVDNATRYGESRHLLASYLGLGLALEGLGQWSLAAQSYRAAVELIEEQRLALSPADRIYFLDGELGAGFKRILAYEGLIRCSVKLGAAAEGLRWAEHTKARRLLDAGAGPRIAPGIPLAVARREELLTERLGALYRQRDEARAKDRALADRLEQTHIPALKDELEGFVAELRRQHPAYAAYKYPQPLIDSELRLEAGEVLLEFAVTETETFLWLLRPGTAPSVRVIAHGREAIDREVRAYRSMFEAVASTADLRSDVAVGRRLHELLVGDALAAAQPGERLVIVPDRSLALLPFEALVVGAQGQQADYLGDHFAIQYAQSATVLSNARAVRRVGGARKSGILVVADPVFSAADDRWQAPPAGERSNATAEEVEWPRLAYTTKIVEGLRADLGAEQVRDLSGAGASERALRDLSLGDFPVIVFATHGAAGGLLPFLQEPALVLSQLEVDQNQPNNDGYLTLSEVLALKLDADVVALTACQTGIGEQLAGEGVLGIGWAFQYAGSRNTLMSLWSVEASSAVQLTERFIAKFRAGAQPQQALQEARQELRRSGYAHPFYWAPFVLMGQG